MLFFVCFVFVCISHSIISHSAGDVEYNFSKLMQKKALHLEKATNKILKQSNVAIIQKFFENTEKSNDKQQYNAIEYFSKYLSQLMQTIEQSRNNTHFIFCFSTNKKNS